MAMNQVQFQAGLSMAQLIQQYGAEAKCAPSTTFIAERSR